MSKAYTWEQIDQLAVQWYELPEEGNEAAKKNLEEQLFFAVFQLLSSPGSQQNAVAEAFGEFWLTDWKRFDPARSSMSRFLRSRLEFRVRDLNRQDNGLRKKTADGEEITIRNSSLDDEEAFTQISGIEDLNAAAALDEILLDELACQCIALILELPDRLHGKANNPEKINYYRMFFTDGVVNYIRSDPAQLFFPHERDLFRAIRLPFLDYFLSQKCRTVPSIALSSTKPYGELVENRPMKPVEQPLPNDVYSAYMFRVEERKAGAPAISQQRQAYRAFLKEILC